MAARVVYCTMAAAAMCSAVTGTVRCSRQAADATQQAWQVEPLAQQHHGQLPHSQLQNVARHA